MLDKERNTEEKIITAAKEVFIEKGLQGARMQEIADLAQINKALLHYYFRSKEKLFDAVFEDSINDLFPKLSSKVDPRKSLDQILDAIVSFYNKYLQENPFIPQFIFHEIWQHPEKLARFIREQNNFINNLYELTKPLSLGEVESKYKTQHFIANVLGMCIFPYISRPIFQRLFFENNEENYDEFLSERTHVILNLFSQFSNPEKNQK